MNIIRLQQIAKFHVVYNSFSVVVWTYSFQQNGVDNQNKDIHEKFVVLYSIDGPLYINDVTKISIRSKI